MIKIENVKVMGWEAAIRGMRNPMNSWNKSDTKWYLIGAPGTNPAAANDKYLREKYCIGDNDLDLMKRLVKSGTDHRKFMRMITVYADITAPLYWWAEYDTYKVGTVRNSCSKMHKLLSKPFEMNDFSFDKLPGYKNEVKQFKPDFDEKDEMWKSLNPHYSVSNLGRIKNDKYNRILSGSLHKDGYMFTTIDGKQYPLHRLVALVFCDGFEESKVVNHKDGNKQNNSADNLEWITQQENVRHSYNNDFQPKSTGTYKGKFTAEQREEIKLLWDSGKISKREIAKKYGVSHTCIINIINDKYKYAENTNIFEEVARPIVDILNELRDSYLSCDNEDNKKQIWYAILQLLPESYNQRSTVMLNYEVLANIYKSRKNHKLDEWRAFCDWIKALPYSELITGGTDE
jgi:hypothetical protein